MAWDINRVILIGRLAGDVDFRSTQGGSHIAKFGLAVGGKPNPDGSDSVSFFNIVTWGKTAEICDKYLSKGKQVAIDGRLTQNRWTAQDGTNRSRVEIVAEKVEFLGSSGGENGKEKKENNDNNFYDDTDFDPSPINF